MKRRNFTKLAILTPVSLFINKLFPKKAEAEIVDNDWDRILFSKVMNNGKSAVSVTLSFKDKDDKMLHYGRLMEMDEPKMEYIRLINDAMKITIRDKVEDRLRKDFNFF